MKNKRIRRAMIEYGLTQNELAPLIGASSNSEVSVMLKRELAKAEQDEIIALIKKASESA